VVHLGRQVRAGGAEIQASAPKSRTCTRAPATGAQRERSGGAGSSNTSSPQGIERERTEAATSPAHAPGPLSLVEPGSHHGSEQEPPRAAIDWWDRFAFNLCAPDEEAELALTVRPRDPIGGAA